MFKKIIPLLLLISFNSWADNVNQIFGDGIFETNWGQSLSELSELFPKGKIKSVSGLEMLTVKDGRTVLGIERSKKHKINYNFNVGKKLNQVRVQFDGSSYPEALNILTATLGSTNLESIQGGMAIGYTRWFNENKTISVAIFKAAGGFLVNFHTYLVITKELELDGTVKKEELGF